MPAHTPVVLSEAGDCGTTMIRVQCRDMGGNHETRHLNNYCPGWVMDTVCEVSSCGWVMDTVCEVSSYGWVRDIVCEVRVS